MDRGLVVRARDGDREAYELLAQSVGRPLFQVAHRILRDMDAAEDAVQSASYRSEGGDLVAPSPGSLLTAVFGPDGALEGSSGCNHFSAAYSTDGDDLAVGPLKSTAMACPSPDLAAQEAGYLAALAASSRWSQEGLALELVNTSGAGKDTTVQLVREIEWRISDPGRSPAMTRGTAA